MWLHSETAASVKKQDDTGKTHSYDENADGNGRPQTRVKNSSNRKRGRNDEATTGSIGLKSSAPPFVNGPPAFFKCYPDTDAPNSSATNQPLAMKTEQCKNAKGDASSGVQDAIDAEGACHEIIGQRNGENNSFHFQLNNDPSLCSFEAAIVSRNDPLQPEMESKMLIFRYGGYFAFHVDESSIVEVKYEGSGIDDKSFSPDATTTNKDNGAPPTKRQRSEQDEKPTTEEIPPSLLITFPSCTFRVFFLENRDVAHKRTENTESSSTVNATSSPSLPSGALGITDETGDKRLRAALSMLEQNFDIEKRKKENHSMTTPLWKMAPPGSGEALLSLPESFEVSSFHTGMTTPKHNVNFTTKAWSHCLDLKNKFNGKSPMSPTSPHNDNSTIKTDGSSILFENGQKVHVDPPIFSNSKSEESENCVHDEDKSKCEQKQSPPDGVEINDANQSSELTHDPVCAVEESKIFGAAADDMDTAQQNHDTIKKEIEKVGDSSAIDENIHQEENSQPHGKNHDDENKNTSCQDGSTETTTDLRYKIQAFETSWAFIEESMSFHPSVSKNKRQQQTNTILLESSAEALPRSYLTMKEFVTAAQHCEEDIHLSSMNMERILERMIPARGKSNGSVNVKSTWGNTGDSRFLASPPTLTLGGADTAVMIDDFRLKMEEYKKAVATKIALLLVPKR